MGESSKVGAGWKQTAGWELRPFADLSHGFVFQREPMRVLVLDRLSMYVLQVATSGPEETAIEKLSRTGVPEPAARFDAEVGRLRGLGLLEEVGR